MRFLKQNTATRVTVGPFLDVTDGKSPELSLTVTGCHLTLMVDDAGVPTLALDADATASGGNNDMVHVTGDNAGFYDLELTAAQVNYVGRAMLAVIDDDVHLPVFHEFMIVPANVYDSFFGTDKLQVHADEITNDLITANAIADNAFSTEHYAAALYTRLGIVTYGTAQAADATSIQLASASAFANDELNGSVVVITGGTGVGQSRVITDYVGSTDTATVDTWTTTPSGTITYVVFAAAPASATSLPAVNLTQIAGSAVSTSTAQLGVNVVQAAGTAWGSGAITAASIATGAIDADSLAADAGTELGTAVWATAARTLTAATNITSTGGTTVPQTGDSFARLGAPAGASVSADIAAIEAQTDDIGVAGAGLTALASAANLAIVAGYLDTEIAAIKAKTDALPASPAAVGSAMTLANDAVSADALSAAAVDKILDEVVEGQGNITLRQSLMAILAFAAGQASGGGTTECVFESPNGVATRITMAVNSAGDRSAVTLNFA